MKQKMVQTEALTKMQRYCAYQERCHQEVRNKLFRLGFGGSALEEIISQLIEEGYLNEERYARLFVQGKFRMNQWGKTKIIQALLRKRVSKKCIEYALAQIDSEVYLVTLRTLLSKKNASPQNENLVSRRNKMYQYAVRKGYESDLVIETLDSLL